MMRIEHIAMWVTDLESMKAFYIKYFGAVANEIYLNPRKKFSSYFLSFGGGARLELMHMEGIEANSNSVYNQYRGLIHFAVSVGSEEKVKEMTQLFIEDGFEVLDGPRWTGDGYYESVVLDPEKNRIEITI